MFTREDLLRLLQAVPFAPFRLFLSDGSTVPVLSREVVLAGRRFALVGLLDPDATDTAFDRWAIVWYLHVAKAEMLHAGEPPFAAPPAGPAESPAGSPA